jgi:hypothetical protein
MRGLLRAPVACAARPRRRAESSARADGSIIAVIMTAHIPHSRNRCARVHDVVIIHRLAPVIGPYMSRAMTAIQVQQANDDGQQRHGHREPFRLKRDSMTRRRTFRRRSQPHSAPTD